MARDWIKPGELLAGRYRIERVLGEGGMGVVVAATHTQLGKKVAVKILRPQFARDEEQAARFSREAHAGVRLTGEHSVQVLDVGQLGDGTPYMVMELLVGADLSEVLTTRKKLSPFNAVDYILQAAEGIAEAHAHGIIHRDIKPQNLFLTHRTDGSPLVKVLDFGLNKDIDNDKALTKSRTIFGSPYYMSPEQMKASRDVDARTDIWALGACLYEFLVGHPPFDAPTVAELMVKVLQEAPVPPHQLEPAVPDDLSTVVLRCLEKVPENRFAGVIAFATAVEPFAPPQSQGVAARIVKIFHMVQPTTRATLPSFAPIKAGSEDPMTRTDASWDSGARRETRVRRGLIAAAISACVVVALGAGGSQLLGPALQSPRPGASAGPPAVPEATPEAAAPEPRVGNNSETPVAGPDAAPLPPAAPSTARPKARPPPSRARPSTPAPAPPAPTVRSEDPNDRP